MGTGEKVGEREEKMCGTKESDDPVDSRYPLFHSSLLSMVEERKGAIIARCHALFMVVQGPR